MKINGNWLNKKVRVIVFWIAEDIHFPMVCYIFSKSQIGMRYNDSCEAIPPSLSVGNFTLLSLHYKILRAIILKQIQFLNMTIIHCFSLSLYTNHYVKYVCNHYDGVYF